MLMIFIFNTTLLDQTEVFLWKYVLENYTGQFFFTVNDFFVIYPMLQYRNTTKTWWLTNKTE